MTAEQDLEVCPAVTVHIARDERIVAGGLGLQFASVVGEGARADEAERLVVRKSGVGVDRREIELVCADQKVLDDVAPRTGEAV